MGVSSILVLEGGSYPVRPRSFVESFKEIIQVFITLQGIKRRMLLGPCPTCDRCIIIIINKIVYEM